MGHGVRIAGFANNPLGTAFTGTVVDRRSKSLLDSKKIQSTQRVRSTQGHWQKPRRWSVKRTGQIFLAGDWVRCFSLLGLIYCRINRLKSAGHMNCWHMQFFAVQLCQDLSELGCDAGYAMRH